MVKVKTNYNVFRYKERVLSLKTSAMIKLVVELWKQVDVKRAVEDESWKFYGRNKDLLATDNFNTLETILSVNLRNLLPNRLGKEIENFIRPIGLRICEWLEMNADIITPQNQREFLNSIVWTYYGTIDEYKSLKVWSPIVDNGSLFVRACFYCDENEIQKIRADMLQFIHINWFNGTYLLMYWTYKIRGILNIFLPQLKDFLLQLFQDIYNADIHYFSDEDFTIENINALMMMYCVTIGNFNALKYFSSKLTFRERSEISLGCLHVALHYERNFNCAMKHDFVDMAFFLYHQINIEDRKYAMKVHMDSNLLAMAQYWQYQNRLVHTITQLWGILSVHTYCVILSVLIGKSLEGRYVQNDLIEDIWYVSPEFLKRAFFHRVSINPKFLFMLDVNEFYNSNFITKDCGTEEKNEIFSFFEV